LYGIRGRFTNEYIHLYNKVGIGHPSGWGEGQGNTPVYGLSTYGGINVGYGYDGQAVFNTYTRINYNWGGGTYGTEAFTIRGTYPSVALRSTTHDNKWLIHNASNLQYYYGASVDNNDWGKKIEFATDGNIWSSYYNDWLSNIFNSKQNASTAITTSNIGSQSVNYAASAGNSNTTSQIVFSDLKTNFPSGSGGGHSFGESHYSMGLDVGNGGWSHPHYRDLIIGYHTGVRIGAHYSGIRFYNNSPTTDTNNDGNGDSGEALLMTIGGYVGTANHTDVVVNNNLFANSSMRSPIFYDSNDTNYYVDPNGTSNLSRLLVPNASSGASLIVGINNTSRVIDDNSRKGLVVNADYYPHIYVNALSNASNDVHGAVISMTGVLSAGGYRRWGMGIANTDPSALSWGWWDNESNPHYSVGGTLGYTSTGARMWLNTDGVLQTTGSMRAPIFYDSDDTTYYLDPNSTSRSFRGRGEILLGPNSAGEYTRLGGNGGSVDYATLSASNGNLHIDCKDGYGLYLNYYSRDTIYLGQSGAITSDGSYYNGTSANAGNADTLDTYHETAFVRLAASSSSPTNGTFAIGSAGGRNFIQSHSGQPLDINPLGNAVTIGTDLTVDAYFTVGRAMTDPSRTRMFMPGGGSYVTTTSVVNGAIRIKLPTQGSGMMMTCTVKVYEYSANKSFTITFGGHRDSNNWYNEFCYIDGDKSRGNLTVRFGVSGGKDCVWIGETDSSWSYPQVFITDFQLGYVGYSPSWATGWEIAFTGSFDAINRTQTAYAKITSENIGSQSVSYATSAGSASSATTSSNVTVNSGNTSAAWYPIVWHSGNTLYSSSNTEIYANGNYIRSQYINTTDNDETGITRFVIKNTDNYHRSATTTTAANIIRGVASGTWGIDISGNAATATTFFTGRTNYKGVTDGAVAGQLMWKNYGNNHTIFDASNSTSPNGGAVNNTNPDVAWTGTYPTLMGWNGSNTYGVRVDSARVADSASSVAWANVSGRPTAVSSFTNDAGYLTAEADTLATVTARGNSTSGNLNVFGNILMTGNPTTTNQNRMIDFTGFDKEGTTDFSDRAYIQHTINDAGHTGSVLVISSQNDADDGIGFLTNASSQIRHNGHVMWDAGNDGAGSGLDADLLDGQQGSYYQPASTAITTGNIASQSVNYATSAGSAPANGGTSTYATYLNPLSGDSNYKLAYTADGARNNAGEWGRAVMYYIPNGQTYGIRVDRADYADSAGTASSASTATTATTANRLERYGIIYGDNWNSYNQNNRLLAISAHGHSGTNRPAGAYTYGSGLSYYNSGSDHYQFFFPENGSSSNANSYKIWYRSGWNDNWGGWRSIVDVYNGACAIDGTVTATGDIIAYSDVRVKENIHTIENALDKTLKLRGVTYNRTDVEDKSTKIGVIAQEIMEVFPEVVSEDETGMYGVSYGNLTAVLIEAIKEQQKQIEELKLEVQKLKSI
jgi:hypothetical protein